MHLNSSEIGQTYQRLLQMQPNAPPVEWPTQAWTTSTPEEQDVDAANLAAGWQVIRQQGLNRHGLLLVRNGKVLLAANQGKLKLDDLWILLILNRCLPQPLPLPWRLADRLEN